MTRDARDGTAAVRNGVLVVTPPEAGGRPARLRGETGVELWVRGAPVTGPVEVADAAAVEVRLPPLEPRSDITLDMASDRMSAMMRVERFPGALYRLEDQPPNREIVLRRLVGERLVCDPPTVDELRGMLLARGVVQGIVPDSLARLVRGSAGAEVVARGEPGRRARDGQLVLHALPPEGAAPRYVRPGTVLAEVVDPDAGELGVDIMGEPLPAGSAIRASLQAGDGARLADRGRIVADIAGHAGIVDGVVVVRDPLVVDADVEDKIVTPGSVQIAGAVSDLAVVRARGDVLVAGAVLRAAVEAGGSLLVGRGAIDSTLRAGHLQIAAGRAAPALAEVAADLQRLHAAVVQVLAAAHGARRPMPPLRAVQLAEQRVAPELDQRVKAAFQAVEHEHGMLHPEAATRLRHAVASLKDVRTGRSAPSTLATLARAFGEEAADLAALDGPPVLELPLAERCKIDVHGVLRFTGRGAVDSTIRVIGALEADGDETAIRGGEVTVDGDARIAEAGVRGSQLRITLAPGSTLHIGIAHAGVVIAIGDDEHRVAALTRSLVLTAPLPAAANAA